MKKGLFLAIFAFIANIAFAQTISINGSVLKNYGEATSKENKTPKVYYNAKATWSVVDYASQRYLHLSIEDPSGATDGWGNILFPGAVWETITDPKSYYGLEDGTEFEMLKAFKLYTPTNKDRQVGVYWYNDLRTDKTVTCIRIEKRVGEKSYPTLYVLIETDATKAFATDIMGILNAAVSKGILRKQ